MKSPAEIVDLMMQKDAFSQWLGVEVLDVDLGFCSLSCLVKEEMLNGFQIAHGGISYSLADSTLAFAANSRGQQCVSVETSISHLTKVNLGDTLTSTAKEIYRGKKTGVYEVKIVNQTQRLVAHFKGTVFVSDELW
jgi:acyl-CoA thioesterase